MLSTYVKSNFLNWRSLSFFIELHVHSQSALYDDDEWNWKNVKALMLLNISTYKNQHRRQLVQPSLMSSFLSVLNFLIGNYERETSVVKSISKKKLPTV
jgi:hypothetical protein